MATHRPSYYEQEKKYLQAKTPEEKLKALQDMLSAIPKNKSTEKLRLNILKRIAKLKEEIREKQEKQKRLGRSLQYTVKKVCKIMISLVSYPNTGKSFFLNKYANLNLDSTEIPFETVKPETGIVNYKKIQIQFVEIPSIYEGFSTKYRYTFSIIRSSNAILTFLDKNTPEEEQIEVIENEMRNNNIYFKDKLPNVKIIREDKGGIKFYGDYAPKDKRPYIELLQSYKIHNATIYFNEPVDIEDFSIILDNSTKLIKFIPVKSNDIEEVFNEIRKKVEFIRVYTKEPKKKPDLEEPLILEKGSTIRDLIEELNESWLKLFKYARVWGKKVKFPGQRVGLDYELEDEDIVEINLK